jgi:hypothetical protein
VDIDEVKRRTCDICLEIGRGRLEAEKQVIRLDGEPVTLKADGCDRSPNAYLIVVGSDAEQIVANAEKAILFRQPALGGPSVEELPPPTGTGALPSRSAEQVCHWTGAWDLAQATQPMPEEERGKQWVGGCPTCNGLLRPSNLSKP